MFGFADPAVEGLVLGGASALLVVVLGLGRALRHR